MDGREEEEDDREVLSRESPHHSLQEQTHRVVEEEGRQEPHTDSLMRSRGRVQGAVDVRWKNSDSDSGGREEAMSVWERRGEDVMKESLEQEGVELSWNKVIVP
jgi:hypothetical protein